MAALELVEEWQKHESTREGLNFNPSSQGMLSLETMASNLRAMASNHPPT